MKTETLHEATKLMKRAGKLQEIVENFEEASADPTNNSHILVTFGNQSINIHEEDYDRIFDAIYTYYQHQLKQVTQQFQNL